MDYTVSLYRKDRFKEMESLIKRPFKDFNEVSDALGYHIGQKATSLPGTHPDSERLSQMVQEIISNETVLHSKLDYHFGITNVLLVVDGELRYFTISFCDDSEIKGSLSFIPSFV